MRCFQFAPAIVRLFRRPDGRLAIPLIALYLLINGLVLLNAFLHDPEVQYDPQSHLAYARVLADGHLPERKETAEYYVPPLPYVFPALVMRWTGLPLWWAAKAAQFFNVGVSMGITLLLLLLCEEIRPDRPLVKLVALLLLGLLPVYYRTLVFLRGEPFVALFSLLALVCALRVFGRAAGSWRQALVLGLSLGLVALSRQLGLFTIVAVAVFALLLALLRRTPWQAALPRLALSLVLCVLMSGWFYHGLKRRYGSAMEFNRETPGLAALFTPEKFDLFFDLHAPGFFTCPVRPQLGMRSLPITYSDIWGDYALYFLVNGRDAESGRWVQGFRLLRGIAATPRSPKLQTNYDIMTRRLGRANAAGLYPALLMLAGIVAGGWWSLRFLRGQDVSPASAAALLAFLFTGAMVGGYVVFLFVYAKDDSYFKASYLLQLYPVLGLLVGALLDDLRQRAPAAARGLVALLGLVLLYNAPLLVTRYVRWPMAEPEHALTGYATSPYRTSSPAPQVRATP